MREDSLPSLSEAAPSWNVQLPKHLEHEVLRCLKDGNEADLDALIELHPDFRTAMRIWAQQARDFGTVAAAESPLRYDPGVVGPYRVVQRIGSGGFGAVFLARRNENERPVAVKVLRKTSPEAVGRLKREIGLLTTLDHPAIVDVFDFGQTEDGYFYYSMEFIAGRVLDSFFYTDIFTNDQFVATLLQICDGLAYIHRKGVVHRDLKPANILVDIAHDSPCAHLLDFGIASYHSVKPLTRQHGFKMAMTGRLLEQTLHTVDGGIFGTLGFMSPEQMSRPSTADSRSDIYSLGVTIYLLLSGKFPVPPKEIIKALREGPQNAYETLIDRPIVPPTQNVTVADTAQAEGPRSIPYARLVAPQLSRRQRKRIDGVILKSLAKDPANRYDDAVLVAENLAWAFGADRLVKVMFGTIGNAVRRAVSWLTHKRHAERVFDANHRARVWFVTDRQPLVIRNDLVTFSAQEGKKLTFGVSTVGIPTWRVIGRLRPRRWQIWRRRDRYEVIWHKACAAEEFMAGIRANQDGLGNLVFIHGYNTSFDEAVIRAAQLQLDMKMNGRVVCYSWPSSGRLHAYGPDAAIVEESEQYVTEALETITSASVSPVHVMAHSMGNRALLRAVSRMHTSGETMSLGQVILAAPDVGQGLFRHLCGAYVASALRCTLYASKNDRALMGSRFLYARGRAGYIPPITLVDGIDTVDASRIGFRLWGLNHSGFGDAREILTDIGTLIRQNWSPENRIGLERQIDAETGRIYWLLIQ